MRAPKRPNPQTPVKYRGGRVTGSYFHVSKTFRAVDTPGGKQIVASPGVTLNDGRRLLKQSRAAAKSARRAAFRAAKAVA